MAFRVSLKIDQGATFRKRMTWKTGTPKVAVDLTGCTAVMQIREEVDSAAVLVELNTTDGGITLGGVNGTIDLYISDEDTAAFTWESGVYDLEITFTNGDVLRKIQGSASVSPEVTRE